MIQRDELIVDNFAGGGGASTGIELALGRSVDIAINHDPEALSMHAANHPNTLHLCENVWAVDIRAVVAGRKVGLAWFSPDCKHFSKAKGGKPVEKRIRGLAWVALRWAGLVKPRVIILENVEEFTTWGPVVDGQPCKRRKGMTFKRWCTQLRNLGYAVEWRELRACDYGAPTIRKRLFVVARRDRQPIVWPNPSHGKGLMPYRTAAECIDWSIPCPSIFLTRDEGRAIGVNRPLAEATMRRIARGVKRYVFDAAEPFIVPLTHIGTDRVESVGDPMRTTTTARRGERALVTPYLARVAHGEYDASGKKRGRGEHSFQEPVPTVTASPEFSLVVPTLIQTGYGEREGQEPRVPGLDKPLGTAVAGGTKHALVTAFISSYYGDKRETDVRGASMVEPIPTQPTENRHALVAAFLSRQFGESVGHAAETPSGTATAGGGGKSAIVTSHMVKLRGTNIGSAADEPLHTVSAGGTHMAEVRAFLIKYFGTDQDPRLNEPMHTVTSKHRFGIVTVHGQDYQIVDIGMRMLTPRELFRAQGFPESYIIDRGVSVAGPGQPQNLFSFPVMLSKTAQVRMCGNSVSPHPAEALVRAQFGVAREERCA